MRFTVIFPLIALYVYCRGVYPLFSRVWVRIGAFALFTFLAVVPSALRFYYGPPVAPDLPQSVMILGNTAQMTVFAWAIAVGVRDAVFLAVKVFRRKTPDPAKSRRWAAGLVALSFATTLFGEWQGMALPEVVEHEIAVENLPADLAGLRIAQLSDLHVSSLMRGDRIEKIVSRVNAARPDLILFTGDFVDGRVQDRGRDLSPLSALRAPLGIFGCEGNHEHYLDYAGWRAFLPTLGIRMLFNEHAVVKRGETSLVIAGLTDLGSGRFGREMPDVDKALKGAPRGFTILLEHQPKAALFVAEHPVDLMLSGHTHGGQTPLVSLAVKLTNAGFVRGLYRVKPAGGTGKALPLYVQTGTQLWNGYPLRILSRNEITVLKLVPLKTTD